jgi:hypothetical protein
MPQATATAAGAAAGALAAPGIAGAAKQRRVGQAFRAEFGCGGLAHENGALRAQPGNGDRIVVGQVFSIGNRPEGGAHADGVDQILHRERNAMQNTQLLAGHDLAFRFAGVGQGLVAANGDEAIQLRLQSLGARQHGAGEFDRRNLLATNAGSKFGSGQEAEFFAHRLYNLGMFISGD